MIFTACMLAIAALASRRSARWFIPSESLLVFGSVLVALIVLFTTGDLH